MIADTNVGFSTDFDYVNNQLVVGRFRENIVSLFRRDSTAAGVSVSGRVTTSEGRGVTNAVVTLTDANGVHRTVVTGRRGSFIFQDVEPGQTYLIGVRSRRYQFEHRVLQVFDNMSDVDFVAGNF